MPKMLLRDYIRGVVDEQLKLQQDLRQQQQQERQQRQKEEQHRQQQPDEQPRPKPDQPAHQLPTPHLVLNDGRVVDMSQHVQMIMLPSVDGLRSLRDLRILTKIFREKQAFAAKAQPFVDAIRSSLVNRSVCEVRRRSGFDNVVTYRISYRPRAERLPLTTVRVTEAEWKIILQRLQLEGHSIAVSPTGERILIKLE